MRILIDECIDERMRLRFPDHDGQTARSAILARLKNRQFLKAAGSAGFDVLITAAGTGIERSSNYRCGLSGTFGN
jgi:hypothetical protein